MIKMTAKKAIRYAGKAIASGEGFSVKGKSHAKLLQALGRADVAESKPAPVVEAPPVVAKPKRAYKRKDMVAEVHAVVTAEEEVTAEAEKSGEDESV